MSEKVVELREKLAELAHEQWSNWMEYLFSKSVSKAGGACMIPSWAVKRWKRQMKTSYCDLPEEEKDSDREEADKFLEIFKQRMTEMEDLLKDIRKDAKMALNGWDKGNEGFYQAQLDAINNLLDGEL